MSKVSPFHSKLDHDPKVYHDESTCKTANNIEDENKVSGTGGRPKCKECEGISG